MPSGHWKDIIDLRSDTITHPTSEMREAMAHAVVGDDVYGEDPTVNRLETMSAERLGKEAALFVASGTMGNLCAILTHCDRGDEIILGNRSHTFLFEAGGVSALGGIHPWTLPNQEDGTLRIEDIEDAVRADDPHYPITRLICLENTHNRCGGTPLSVAYTSEVAEFAKKKGLFLHIDGARIFHAAIAQGVDACELVDPADSVMFCLSKALCAPVGSILCGSDRFIHKARRIRKQLGGGMRQAGILAAAGIVALEKMVDRIIEDHRRARELAEGLCRIRGLKVEKNPPPTNMVYLRLENDLPYDAPQIDQALQKRGVLIGDVERQRIRLVVHYWIDDEAISRTIRAFKEVMDSESVQ